jgi:hypothetical protein
MLRIITISAVFLSLAACGGGGGETPSPSDDPQTSTKNNFSTAKLDNSTTEQSFSRQLTGLDSNGNTFTGTTSSDNRSKEMLDGVLVIPNDNKLTLTTTGKTTNLNYTTYYDDNGYLIKTVNGDVTCKPVYPDKVPTLIKNGDFGTLSDLTCNDGSTESRNWRVEDTAAGSVNLILNSTTKDEFNNVTKLSENIYTIDGNDNFTHYKTISTDTTLDYTVTLTSI